MKRALLCFLAVVLLFCLFACKKQIDTSGNDDTSAVTPDISDTANETDIESDTKESIGETAYDSCTEEATANADNTSADEKTTVAEADPPSTNPPVTDPPATKAPVTDPPKQETTAPPVKTCNHSNTEVRNKKDATTSSEGYTGDTYCKDCGKLISSGTSIPKIKQTVSVSHDYYDVEMEIFRLINEERVKNGVSPLSWDESLYAGTKVRATEVATNYSHIRPDGTKYYTALDGMYTYVGENFLRTVINCVSTDPAGIMTNAWI